MARNKQKYIKMGYIAFLATILVGIIIPNLTAIVVGALMIYAISMYDKEEVKENVV